MATLDQKIEAERNAREMVERGGMPQPDWVEYGYTCIRLIWSESKVVLVVDIDEPPEGPEPGDEYLVDLDADDLPDGFEAFSSPALFDAQETFDDEDEEAA